MGSFWPVKVHLEAFPLLLIGIHVSMLLSLKTALQAHLLCPRMKHLLCWVQWHRPVFLGVWETEAGRSQILFGLQSGFNADLNYIMRSRLRNQSKPKQNNTGTLGLVLAYVILTKGPVLVFSKLL